MKKKMLSLNLILTLISCEAIGNHIEVNPTKAIRIEGAIGKGLEEQTQQLERLINSDAKPSSLQIYINSPGGVIRYGVRFLSVMHRAQYRGIHVQCVVGNMAASMAFIILSQCDERVALRTSLLLFHPPRLAIPAFGVVQILPDRARMLADALSRVEAKINPMVRKSMGMSKAKYYKHYHRETMWSAAELDLELSREWIKLVDDIQGIHIFSPDLDEKFKLGSLIWRAK